MAKPPNTPIVREFLDAKVRALAARARRLARFTHHTVGIRAEDIPYTPSLAHFEAVNRRLAKIDDDVRAQLAGVQRELVRQGSSADDVLARAAGAERSVDRARRTFALYFDVLSQRGTRFARSLAACDSIAADCFAVVRRSSPHLWPRPLLKPVTYLESSFSPATFRRGVQLRRLLGEQNPFPLVRVPFERIESPWGFGVLLHEIGHNLQADLGVWQETQAAVQRRVLGATRNPLVARLWGRWHKEIFADLIALQLGGPASARSMEDFLSYPAARVMAFRALSVHPVPYLRVFILAEMLRRMGFREDADRTRENWHRLYSGRAERSRVPRVMLATSNQVIRHVVDEIAFRPRRGLAQRTLADVVPYGPAEERAVRAAAVAIGSGSLPANLAPRLAVSASRYAFDQRLAAPQQIANTVLAALAARAARSAPHSAQPVAASRAA